jgi:hypothetical protein
VSHTACTISLIAPNHNPDEGRTIINNNFGCLSDAITNLEIVSATGSTSVSSGSNINVSLTILSGVPDYAVSVIDNPVFSSVSATTISASTLYSGSTNVGDLFTAITASVVYTNTGATTATIGGISAGSTFSGKTMQQMWDSLLYPYQVPAFSSFARTNLSTTYELGETVLVGSQTFSWAFSNASNVSANTTTIVQNVSPVTTLYGPGSNTSPSAITVVTAYSAGTSTTTTLYTISATNSSGTSFSTTISRSWRPKIYYGTSLTTPLVAANITALLNNPLASGFAGTYSFAAGDYKYFCYPSSFGTATTFKDTATNLAVPMETLYVVSITNAYGVTVNYNVHRSTNILGGSINIQIS